MEKDYDNPRRRKGAIELRITCQETLEKNKSHLDNAPVVWNSSVSNGNDRDVLACHDYHT